MQPLQTPPLCNAILGHRKSGSGVCSCWLGEGEVGYIHRVGWVLNFFSSRWNWDSPNPSPARECAPPPPERGGGQVPIPTRRHTVHCGTLYMYVLCEYIHGKVYSACPYQYRQEVPSLSAPVWDIMYLPPCPQVPPPRSRGRPSDPPRWRPSAHSSSGIADTPFLGSGSLTQQEKDIDHDASL